MQLDKVKAQWEATPLWQRLVLVILFPLVVAGAIWFYVIKPSVETKERLIKEKKQLSQEIAKYRRMIKPQVLESMKKQLEALKAEEEKKKKELERVVGKIPTVEELEKVFGEINFLASLQNLVITKISLSQPRTLNLTLVEKEGKKIVQPVITQQPQQIRRRGKPPPKKTKKPPQKGVPVTTVRVNMNLEGSSIGVYRFLKSIQERGLVSYPVSVSVKPLREGGVVSAEVVIDVILQK